MWPEDPILSKGVSEKQFSAKQSQVPQPAENDELILPPLENVPVYF